MVILSAVGPTDDLELFIQIIFVCQSERQRRHQNTQPIASRWVLDVKFELKNAKFASLSSKLQFVSQRQRERVRDDRRILMFESIYRR